MFGKKKQPKVEFDKENQKPVLKCSICTGEKVAGFKNIQTGKFDEVMLIRNDKELDVFKAMYDLEDVTKEY